MRRSLVVLSLFFGLISYGLESFAVEMCEISVYRGEKDETGGMILRKEMRPCIKITNWPFESEADRRARELNEAVAEVKKLREESKAEQERQRENRFWYNGRSGHEDTYYNPVTRVEKYVNRDTGAVRYENY